MSWHICPQADTVEIEIVPRSRDLGGFEVRRALPSGRRRMVGPFVFCDQMGPSVLRPGSGLDVRPHPHIGLATITYLFRGEILHRDSLGTVQALEGARLLFLGGEPMDLSYAEAWNRLLQESDQLRAAEAGIQAQEAQFRPTVFAFGRYDLHRDDALLTEPDWIYGIGLRFTLLSNQGRREGLHAAREQAAQVKSGREEARVQLSMLAARAVSELDSARFG